MPGSNAEACGCDYGVEPPWICDAHRAKPAVVPERSAWIGVDLDGTLAIYPHSFPQVGPPIPPMVERVRGWLAEGRDIRIFTARVGDRGQVGEAGQEEQAFIVEQRQLIEAWCQEHLGQVLPITAQKDFCMVALWDDRCVQLETNTGRRADEATPESLVDQREIGKGEGVQLALTLVLRQKRYRVAVSDPPLVRMEDTIRVVDIEALRLR